MLFLSRRSAAGTQRTVAKPPLLKIVGLHVEGLRALRRADWPADGMGWGDAVPDMVVIGGVNGSGKTTLLELLFESVGAGRTFGA